VSFFVPRARLAAGPPSLWRVPSSYRDSSLAIDIDCWRSSALLSHRYISVSTHHDSVERNPPAPSLATYTSFHQLSETSLPPRSATNMENKATINETEIA
jgi:hypothetical protein